MEDKSMAAYERGVRGGMRGARTYERLLRAIYDELQASIGRAIAPWTRQGKLDLSSPAIVGVLRPERGGTGGDAVPPPYAYLTDADGNYLTDADGAYLFEYL